MSATIRQLADALDLSVAGAHKCVKRGMPKNSIAAALSWYKINGRINQHQDKRADIALEAANIVASAITAPAQKQKDIEEMNRKVESTTEATVKQYNDHEHCREALNEQRQLRKHSAAQVARLHHSGDIEASRRWTQTHQQYFGRQAAYEKQVRDLMERDKITMRFEDAERAFREILQDVRTIATAMPSALAAKVNPQDPLLAQKLLEEWRDKTLFRSIHENKRPSD